MEFIHDKLTLLARMAEHPDWTWVIEDRHQHSGFYRCMRHLPEGNDFGFQNMLATGATLRRYGGTEQCAVCQPEPAA